MKAHPCNCLKLCIGSTCTNRRNLVIPGRIVLHQLSERRNRILGYIQIIYKCRIKKRFQLQKDDIRFFIFLGCRKVLFCLFDSFDLRLRVISRTFNTCIKDRSCKTIWISIILICECYISKVIGKYPFLKGKLCNTAKSHNSCQDQRDHISVSDLLFVFWPLDKQDQQPEQHKSDQDAA